MKKLLLALLLAGGVGFLVARHSESKPAPPIKTVAVDCYDKSGNLVPDQFAQYGGVQTACAPGQTTKPRITAH